MTLTTEEREFIRSLPKRIDMCPKLQAAKDKSLRAALLAEFNDPSKKMHFVFDRIPDQNGCTFIEVENESGQSICAGEWRVREDGLAELVVNINDTAIADRVMRVIKGERG